MSSTIFFPAGRPRAWDRLIFPVFLALIWFGILIGFVPRIVAKVQAGSFHYPLIVHVHAAAFVGWLVLLTAQMVLINQKNFALHKRIGLFGTGLAGMMLVLGLAASIVVDRLHFGQPNVDPPAFLIIQLTDLINFGVLAAAGFLMRNDRAAHKRLILLATIFISDAGWGRWLGDTMESAFGTGFLGEWMAVYVGDFVLVALFAAADVIAHRRLNPAFVKGAGFGLSLQLIAIYLFVSPWWGVVATRLIGY